MDDNYEADLTPQEILADEALEMAWTIFEEYAVRITFQALREQHEHLGVNEPGTDEELLATYNAQQVENGEEPAGSLGEFAANDVARTLPLREMFAEALYGLVEATAADMSAGIQEGQQMQAELNSILNGDLFEEGN